MYDRSKYVILRPEVNVSWEKFNLGIVCSNVPSLQVPITHSVWGTCWCLEQNTLVDIKLGIRSTPTPFPRKCGTRSPRPPKICVDIIFSLKFLKIFFQFLGLYWHCFVSMFSQMLHCIIGMVDKTKRALAVLQERSNRDREELAMWMRRHAEGLDNDMKKRTSEMMASTLRQTEDRVTEVKRRAGQYS